MLVEPKEKGLADDAAEAAEAPPKENVGLGAVSAGLSADLSAGAPPNEKAGLSPLDAPPNAKPVDEDEEAVGVPKEKPPLLALGPGVPGAADLAPPKDN